MQKGSIQKLKMQKETGANEQTNTDTPDPYDLSRATETKYQMKTKRVLISKEQKTES